MKRFMEDNFLLNNKTAEKLYEGFARDMPIFDYHCHLSPKEIAKDKRYRNITELWLGGDHYKWRAMRINGVEETYITGDAEDKEKFMKWAETVPYCLGNPLYHWTHLELKRYFGINKLLSPKTAEEIWQACNNLLNEDGFTARGFIRRSNVKAICTTDDPTDSLEYHKEIEEDSSFDVAVLPAFRPDKAINIEKAGFTEWIGKLSNAADLKIQGLADLKKALKLRLEFFHKMGCRLSDHGLDTIVFSEGTEEEADATLKKALQGGDVTENEIEGYKTNVMLFLGRQYSALGWTMQLHLGCMRNNNLKMFRQLGADTGFDSVGDFRFGRSLAAFLSKLDEREELPKTILYTLNPGDNEMLATISGCFQSGGIPGKIQFGSGWWFNDQKDGMLRQMTALANMGLISRFVGMLTDSRSFLSYTRHEYFRRILCDLVGEWAENGEVPEDIRLLGNMIKDICFNNAKNYFGISFKE